MDALSYEERLKRLIDQKQKAASHIGDPKYDFDGIKAVMDTLQVKIDRLMDEMWGDAA